jgi:hypothetical protein
VGSSLLVRGVWLAPWFGDHGELVLVAITSDHRKLEELTIPLGADHVRAADELWDRLEAMDPVPSSAGLGAPPRFRFRPPRRALHLYISR